MSIIYDTTGKTVQVTAISTAKALHDNIQTTFAGSTYMQYLIPDSGSILNALYIFQNGWTFLDTTSVGYMTTGGWQSANGNDKWTNALTISGDSFTGIQLYYNQTGTPTNFSSTGLVNALIKVRSGGTDVASQAYTVYQRTFQKQYSQFSTTASSGGVDTLPLSCKADQYLTIASATLAAYSDLSIAWASIYRSAFDGASTTKYTLNGTLASATTTVTVNEAIDSSVPSSGTIAIGNSITQEVISYTGKGTYTFTGCTRSQYRTTAPTTWAANTGVSTNTANYTVQIKTTSSARRLSEAYNWIQYELGLASDIDTLSGGYIGKITNALVAYTGTMATLQGVWIEGFAAADGNSITYVDQSSVTHSPPLTVAITVNFDATITSAGGEVAVFSLDAPGYTDATYTPAHILATIINVAASGTSASTSLTYSADVPVRVVVRGAGYQQFSLYTTITSAGLTVAAQNPVDSAY